MWATEWFLKWEIKTLVDKLRDKEEEIKKLKSEIENMKKVGRENIETLDKMSAELENYSESFKRYRDFEKQELADSLYDMEQENKKLKEERIFSLWEWDYMILTSTTPQLKLIKKDNSDLYSNITIWTTQK